ncbi:Cof-type HAD-IIB family hydrolase [uncultured Lactobacillus sp.]|uniref:Cof-type HAD-IIB family hydrolase n=1 Tax=uncultured Lactobacillus sp. TaxID=153152 RepID=UPI00260AEB67|nr:Cof-type HAD-IIB family hydrolase [uncultured Lactobacillus sp.]
MNIKLIAVDLDGTLLNSQQQVTPLTKQALQRAAAAGIKVVPCSGRPFPGVKGYLDELNLADKNQYAVTFNGALVFNLSGDIIVRELLHYDDFKYFYDLSQKYKMQFHFELEDRFVTCDHFLNYLMSRESWLTRMPIEISSFDKIDKNLEFTKGMYSGKPADIVKYLDQLPQELFERYNVSTSDPTLIEINSRTASKGNALKELGKVLNIKPEEIMIFGDQKNDLSMFSEPGFHKVAMGNAIDIIKQKADFVTKTNDQDGIAYALEEMVF